MTLKSTILSLISGGPCGFDDLRLGARMYISMTEEESLQRVPEAIRELIAERKIAASTTSGGICYHLADGKAKKKTAE